MEILLTILLIFFVGVGSSFLGAICGGGGLISIPFLIFIGLPPQIAIPTNKMGAVGLSIGAILKFLKEDKIVWKFVLPFSIISVFGVFIGGNLLLNIDQTVLSKVVSIMLLLFLPVIFINKKIGIKRKKVSKSKIESIDSFSGHADYKGLLNWLRHFSPKPKKVFVVHGNEKSIISFSKKVQKMGLKTHIPSMGEKIVL